MRVIRYHASEVPGKHGIILTGLGRYNGMYRSAGMKLQAFINSQSLVAIFFVDRAVRCASSR